MSEDLNWQEYLVDSPPPEIPSHSSVSISAPDSNNAPASESQFTPATTPEASLPVDRSKNRVFSHVELHRMTAVDKAAVKTLPWPRLDNIIGEATIGKEHYYYANYEGGIAYKVSQGFLFLRVSLEI